MVPKCYQIEAPYFTAGFVMLAGSVQKVAPIIKYMICWPRTKVEAYCNKKGWKLTEIY